MRFFCCKNSLKKFRFLRCFAGLFQDVTVLLCYKKGKGQHPKRSNKMAATVTVRAKLTSKIGFYIGDVCYEMTDEDYYADWSNNFEDFEGEHELRGHKFAIGGTAYGDGEYEDQYGHRYGVDSGTIGILPYELCKDKNISELDRYGRFVRATSATFTAEDGEFDIKLNTQQSYHISTNDYEEDEEDDYYDDEDYDYYDDSDEEDED